MFDFYLGVENRWIAVRVAACDPLRKGQQCDCALECGEDIGAVSPSFCIPLPQLNVYKYKKSFLLNEGGYRDGKL